MNYDSLSIENKLRFLGVPMPLQIPLDADLVEAYATAPDHSQPLNRAEILLLQVIRLLRDEAKHDQPPGTTAEPVVVER